MTTPNVFLTLAAAGTLCIQSAFAQRSPYQHLKVRSCPQADSLLGPAADDTKGRVRAFYYRDSTYLTTSPEHSFGRLFFGAKFAGPRPTQNPAVQVDLMFRGSAARALGETPTTPTVTILLDDSVTFDLTAVLKGRFVGPSSAPPLLPLSALILPADFVLVAQASSITVRVGSTAMQLTRAERRDFRALYRVAVCPGGK